MDKKFRILLLEDVLADAKLIEYELQKGDFLFVLKRVATEEAFQKALKEFKPDIVLADYKLPLFNGISALRIVKENCPNMPFIFVSGYRGEELAVETMKGGAKDYILKDNLFRLVPSVRLVLNEQEERKKHRQAEEELQSSRRQLEIVFQAVADGIIVYDDKGKILYVNDLGAKISGFPSAKEILKVSGITAFWERIGRRFEIKDEFGNPFLLDQLPGCKLLKGKSDPEATICFEDKVTGNVRWVLVKSRPIFGVHGEVQMVVKVISDITGQKEQEKRKDEFIIAASHELKTPLTSLKAFTQFLEKLIDKNKDKEYKHYIIKIDKQTDKLIKLVSDLLDLSKIETGRIKFHKEYFDFNKLVREVTEETLISSNFHKIIIQGKITGKIYGDKGRLSQVLTNLLSNAIKYSPEGNEVVIKLSEDNDKATIAVQDSGIGIDKQYQNKIFDRFFRINDRDEKTFPGLGMGLYISYEIVKRHGGQMWVESVKGKGSTFYITTPLKSDRLQPPEGGIWS